MAIGARLRRSKVTEARTNGSIADWWTLRPSVYAKQVWAQLDDGMQVRYAVPSARCRRETFAELFRLTSHLLHFPSSVRFNCGIPKIVSRCLPPWGLLVQCTFTLIAAMPEGVALGNRRVTQCESDYVVSIFIIGSRTFELCAQIDFCFCTFYCPRRRRQCSFSIVANFPFC